MDATSDAPGANDDGFGQARWLIRSGAGASAVRRYLHHHHLCVAVGARSRARSAGEFLPIGAEAQGLTVQGGGSTTINRSGNFLCAQGRLTASQRWCAVFLRRPARRIYRPASGRTRPRYGGGKRHRRRANLSRLESRGFQTARGLKCRSARSWRHRPAWAGAGGIHVPFHAEGYPALSALRFGSEYYDLSNHPRT